MASQTIDQDYFKWVYNHFGVTRSPARAYLNLCAVLHDIPFTWFVHNDDNRALDGIALRQAFLDMVETREKWGSDVEKHIRRGFLEESATVLEVLVSLANRAWYNSSNSDEHDPAWWMNTFFQNMGFIPMTDDRWDSRTHEQAVRLKIDRWIHRRYLSDGRGGLFPLRHPEKNQVGVELWYQMQAYMIERGL